MCDDLVLLAGGRVVYTGPTADSTAYFDSIGFPVPPNTNPAEHYLALMSINANSPDLLEASKVRLDKLVNLFAKSQTASAAATAALQHAKTADAEDAYLQAAPRKRRPILGPLQQVRLLFLRAFRQVTRDKKTNISRLMSSLMSALLFGSIYWRIGYAQNTIQDRLGLLQVCCINAAMSALVKTLQVFCKEREIVNRERTRGSYDVLPYFTSKLCAELPISALFPVLFSCVLYPMVRLSGGPKRIATFLGLITLESFTSASYGLLVGSLAPTQEAAVAIGPASFIIFIVFGGLYIAESNVPSWLSWVPRASIIKHAFEGLCVNEFTGIKFEAKRPWDVRTGEQQLQRLSWSESTVSRTCVSQLRVLAFNYLATYIVLSSKTPKFQPLASPEVIEDVTDSKIAAQIVEQPNTRPVDLPDGAVAVPT
jgi:ABC-type multidrug transport system permease subunit